MHPLLYSCVPTARRIKDDTYYYKAFAPNDAMTCYLVQIRLFMVHQEPAGHFIET